MTCYNPLQAWQPLNKTLSKKLVFKDKCPGIGYREIQVACGQCIGCRLKRSREWGIRCIHEASLYDKNCFITLTYNKFNLPVGNSLVLEHFQLFMKRLRKKFGEGIRFYHCGEYGENYGRPHYHAILFNHDFEDKELWINNGHKLYRSRDLEKLWTYGFSSIGSVTLESACYVARYILKKQLGPDSDKHYEYCDPDSGELLYRKKEYTTMSRRPGIGKNFFDLYYNDIYPNDEITIAGKKHTFQPPRYYDGLYELIDADQFEGIKQNRIIKAESNPSDNLLRLSQREKCKKLQIKKLIRTGDFEND